MSMAVAPLSESASHALETWVSSNLMPPAKKPNISSISSKGFELLLLFPHLARLSYRT